MSDLPSLLIFSAVQGDSRRYRTFHLYEQARLAGIPCELSHVTAQDFRQKVEWASVVIMHRAPFDAQIEWLERVVHQKGGVLIFDLDDLVFEPEAIQFIHSPDFSDPIRLSLYQEDIRRFRKTLELCDHVITTNEFLAGRVRQLGKPVSIHRNAFSSEMLAISERANHSRRNKSPGLVVGYASGTPTHDQDFALIQPALLSILKQHANVRLCLVGQLDPGKNWGGVADRVQKVGYVPWRDLPALQSEFDINLAPLCIDNPFGQSKSEIKYVEAALLNIPTIASPSEAFKIAIRHVDNGFLAGNLQEWEQVLDDLIVYPDMRITAGEHAYRDALLRYHPLVRAQELVNFLDTILGVKLAVSNRVEPSKTVQDSAHPSVWSSAVIERSPSLVRRGLYTLRYRSSYTLLKQIWIYLRRLVSPLFPFRNP